MFYRNPFIVIDTYEENILPVKYGSGCIASAITLDFDRTATEEKCMGLCNGNEVEMITNLKYMIRGNN